ncbi:hypothetical protein Q9L58_010006 [Maublancomyces gigas]|uniref:Uncharacterized protein n=1 Tax=Discina gigas TaxID=1032678 RepID=A0ABR3G5B6_9PEZI
MKIHSLPAATSSAAAAASTSRTTTEVLPTAASFPKKPPAFLKTIQALPIPASVFLREKPPLVVDWLSESPDPMGPTRRQTTPQRPTDHNDYIISRMPPDNEDEDTVVTAFIQHEAKDVDELKVETVADAQLESEVGAEKDVEDDEYDE